MSGSEHRPDPYWENLNKMSPAKKWEAFWSLYWTARKLKSAGFKVQFPDMTDEEIETKVRESFLYAND